MRSKIFKAKLKALTLMELLVVLAIIGILLMVALPNLMPLISKAKSTEAQIQLEHLHTLEKTYFYTHSKYSPNMNEIGFEIPKKVSEGGSGNYQYEIVSASTTSFKAKATAVADFDGDGTFNVWEIDHEKKLTETVPD